MSSDRRQTSTLTYVGKVGNTVGYKIGPNQYGLKPFTIPRDPKTPAQVLQRVKFGLLATLGASLQAVVQEGYSKWRRWNKELGNFVKLNYDALSGTDPEGISIDYEALKMSDGKYVGVQFGTPSFTDPKKVTVPIAVANTDARYAPASDNVYLAAYCPDTGRGVISDGSATRASESVSLDLPGTWQGMKVHVYGFTKGKKLSAVSESDYVGSGTVA